MTYYVENLFGMVGGEFCLLAWGLTFETTGGWSVFLRSSYIPHNTLRGRCIWERRFCSALYTRKKLLRAITHQGVVGRDLRGHQTE